MKKIILLSVIIFFFIVSCSDMVEDISDPEGTKTPSTGVTGVWDQSNWDQADWGN